MVKGESLEGMKKLTNCLNRGIRIQYWIEVHYQKVAILQPFFVYNKKIASETAVPGDESPFEATVISDAHGAKIVENLRTLVKKTENG